MEARVDIRKLQLLNDRITQTIDALNQVRMSVHGLQHATAGVPGQSAYGAVPQQQPFYGQSVYGQPQTFGALPQQPQAFGPWQQPYTQQQAVGQVPFSSANLPYAMNGIGIQHTTATPFGVAGVGILPLDIEQRVMEARASDPSQLARTFPQAFVPTMGW